jgi:hypothetical protein
MPLNDKDKSDARDAITLALELNEPETMLEGLRRLCIRKAIDAHLGDNERARFRSCADALISVQEELASADKQQARANAPETAQGEQSEQT